MREIPRIKPLPPTGGKSPAVPWAIATSTAIFIVIMLGTSNQYLARFQQPYNFDATSEMTVELIDAPVVFNLLSKPDVRNQFGNSDAKGHSFRPIPNIELLGMPWEADRVSVVFF